MEKGLVANEGPFVTSGSLSTGEGQKPSKRERGEERNSCGSTPLS